MRKMSIILVVMLVVIMFAFSACAIKPPMAQKEQPPENTVTEQKEVMPPKDSMVKNTTTTEVQSDVMPAKTDSAMQVKNPGSYEIYNSEKIASASGNIVLFFHASWCPSCRGLSKSIEDNLNDIPSDLVILKVNYDDETQLKQKYGVTYQHTLVQVDKDGKMIKKWSGSSSLNNLLREI